MVHEITIELIDKDENYIDSDAMDYADNFTVVEQIAKKYVKEQSDGWGLITEYKRRARPTDMIEIWIKSYMNRSLCDYTLVGRIK